MIAKELVLLGGGHSHVEVLRAWGAARRQTVLPLPPHSSPARPVVPTVVSQDDGAARPQQQEYQQKQQLLSNGNSFYDSADDRGPRSGIRTTECYNSTTKEGRPPGHGGSGSGSGSGGSSSGRGSGSSGGVQLTLISRGRYTPYSGMVPGWASGFYSYDDCHIDLQRLAAYAGAKLVTAEATGLDVRNRRVLFSEGRPPLPYDVLSINMGITPGQSGVAGAHCNATPVKPIDSFVRRYEQLLERYRASLGAARGADVPSGQEGQPEEAAASAAAERGNGTTDQGSRPQGNEVHTPLRALRVCVVGGGAGGVELAAAVQHRLTEERLRFMRGNGAGGQEEGKAPATVHVSLVSRGGMLAGHPPHVRSLVQRLLAERGVDVREGDGVASVNPGELILQSGVRMPYDECLWCTEASPASWLADTGLPTDARGFLLINDQLQMNSGAQEVFAAGDVATCTAHPRPKAGVYAVRQGPPLAANLRAFIAGEKPKPFVPQPTAMALISLGDRFCVVSRTGAAASTGSGEGKGGRSTGHGDEEADGPEWPLGWLLNGFGGLAVAVTGPLLWRWKDSIDRSFMRRYGADLDVGKPGAADGVVAEGV